MWRDYSLLCASLSFVAMVLAMQHYENTFDAKYENIGNYSVSEIGMLEKYIINVIIILSVITLLLKQYYLTKWMDYECPARQYLITSKIKNAALN